MAQCGDLDLHLWREIIVEVELRGKKHFHFIISMKVHTTACNCSQYFLLPKLFTKMLTSLLFSLYKSVPSMQGPLSQRCVVHQQLFTYFPRDRSVLKDNIKFGIFQSRSFSTVLEVVIHLENLDRGEWCVWLVTGKQVAGQSRAG